ncbi:MAG: sigma 54-interacting transcriptional regulator [Planctomycetes bacterium]|nr:sigma 54-interacting transcriptional regulator [Planctomycetota bacterium]
MGRATPSALGIACERTTSGARRVLHGPAGLLGHVADRAASVDCPLLLIGETGVGKGVLAEWIHAHSTRSAGPFIPVNCGAIPETLIDSQLFGHARGAFSGADKAHLGLVRAAEGGTLLLDEIGELPLTAQIRLLRLLEEREAQPVGYSRPVQVNVRIIAAAIDDLREAVLRGTFREDLYFRLDIIRLELEPLRQCPQEIRALVDEFNAEFADLYHQPMLEFDQRCWRLLHSYHWPGNVRELRTVMERLHVLCDDRQITIGDLRRFALPAESPTSAVVRPRSLQEARLETVTEALAACGGNIARAASTLGVHRSTVYRWLARRPLSVSA